MDNSIFSSGFLWRRALWIVPCALLLLLCGLVGYAQAHPAEQASIPYIEVNPDWDYISGINWPLGSDVQISIDDPATGQNPDYQFSAIAAEDPHEQTFFTLYFGSQYDLNPGDVVTASDGVTTKLHIATTLHILGASVEGDTLWGTGDPGSNIHVNFGQSPRLDNVFVGLDGSWLVDFTDIYDVQLQDWGTSEQYDEDQDRTSSKWVSPTMTVDRKSDWISGHNWLPGGTVLFSIYAAPGEPQPLQTFSVEAGYLEDDGCLGCFFLELSGQFDIQVGQLVQATDGVFTKSLTVSRLQHTAFDFTLDTVTGIAEPGAAVNIDCNDEFEQIHVDRTVDPASEGSWTADFANPAPDNSETLDFTQNILCTTDQQDSDADRNTYHEGSPEIDVEVDGNIWLPSHKPPVTVTIDDPDTGAGVDFSITVLDGRVSSDQLQGYVIQPGDLVTATDGDGYFTKQTVVTELAVTGVDILNDRVYGTAAPDSTVEVSDENWVAVIQTLTGADGNWMADFSGLFDIVKGSLGFARQYDVDYDSTSKNGIRRPARRVILSPGMSGWRTGSPQPRAPR